MNLLLAIPSYNESERLPKFLPKLLERIALLNMPVDVEVVDDGSRPEESEITGKLVSSLRSVHARLLPMRKLPVNQGKGGAVYTSWKASMNSYDHLAFVDADGSISPEETCRLLHEVLEAKEIRSVFSSRVRMLGMSVERSVSRHLMGRVFATLVGTLIDNRVYDSQCGLKTVPSADYKIMSPNLHETRFAFDVELLACILHMERPVVEMPVNWTDVAGSKVKPVRDTMLMLIAIFRIRRRRATWHV